MGAEPAFAVALLAAMAVAAAVPTRFDDREDHFALQIVAAVASGLFGAGALALLWPAVGAATLVRAVTGRPGWRGSLGWLLLSASGLTVGIAVAAAFHTGVLHRSFPVTLGDTGDFGAAVATTTVGWVAGVVARCTVMTLAGRPLLPWSPRAFDSALVPYLLPCMAGFPLVVASVALYHPDRPWASFLALGWAVPVHAACAYELRRRDLAHELRRDALAAQRLAAVGEVSARVVHQSRHQVGLMGWSIHRLRAALDGVPGAERELDALAEAKDRLTRMLASDLLLEPVAGDDDGDVVAISAAGLVAGVVAPLADRARGRGVELRIDDAGDDAGDGGAGAGVPGRLHDAVFNLVDNAVDAATSLVTVAVTGDGGRVRITVADDGPGLVGTPFQPFSTTKPGGMGMGLPIAEALVADVGGSLHHERAGGLTTFTVDVPASVGVRAGRVTGSDDGHGRA